MLACSPSAGEFENTGVLEGWLVAGWLFIGWLVEWLVELFVE